MERDEDEQVEQDDEIETEASENETLEEDEADEEEQVEQEEEIFEIDIDDKTYCTNNSENGIIWDITEDKEQGEKVGYFKDSEPFFYADEN